jgi:hypothetical protein
MPVPVMNIRNMCVFVSHPSVSVRMRMRFDHRSVVHVHMMLIVEMQVVMLENFVCMNVAVPLANQQKNPSCHENRPH